METSIISESNFMQWDQNAFTVAGMLCAIILSAQTARTRTALCLQNCAVSCLSSMQLRIGSRNSGMPVLPIARNTVAYSSAALQSASFSFKYCRK